ncbi:unnamed protein product [Phytophthora fragariaefolia]|uniref:Unnamed protein product n=1 Tax=Phytophthora fragariaefolia TaxID=1490495 RepID=A0A9W6XT25_9STRA|nr:unnamed protein product [Phytophthora fragariaefolia]
MSSNDPAEVICEKVKSNGAVVKKRVPTFRDGDWKDWLERLLRLSEYYVCMGYAADDEEDQVTFVEDIQRLTESHCPDGTRGMILDEMSALKKTRNVSVGEYTRSFRKLGRMLNYITDNEAIPTSDVIRMYKNGMPIDWQIEVNRLSRSWEYNDLVHQFELIEGNEQEEEVLRNSGRGSRSRAGQSAQQQQKGKNQERGQAPRQNNQNSQSRGQPRQHRNNDNNGKYCMFCKRNNHLDAQCFRDPESPAYRPRRPNNRGSGTNKNHNNVGDGSDRAFAAMQEQVAEMAPMMQEMKRRQEEELNALRFYRQDELSVMTMTSSRRLADCHGRCVPVGERSIGGRLLRGAITAAMVSFDLYRNSIKKLWAMRTSVNALAAPQRSYPRRGRNLSPEDVAERVQAVPLCQRQTQRALPEATGIPRSTLQCHLADGVIRRAVSRVKPTLTDGHKDRRIQWALAHVDMALIRRGTTVIVQQDDAGPHVREADAELEAAGGVEGWRIKMRCQPPRSPDLNVLDLGFFALIQALQYRMVTYDTVGLIEAVQNAFDEIRWQTLDKCFVTLQKVMEVILVDSSGNGFKLPRVGKHVAANGRMPLSVTASEEAVMNGYSKLVLEC